MTFIYYVVSIALGLIGLSVFSASLKVNIRKHTVEQYKELGDVNEMLFDALHARIDGLEKRLSALEVDNARLSRMVQP